MQTLYLINLKNLLESMDDFLLSNLCVQEFEFIGFLLPDLIPVEQLDRLILFEVDSYDDLLVVCYYE